MKNQLSPQVRTVSARNVFVAYDFTIGGTLPTDLETLSLHPPGGLKVNWSGDWGPQPPGGLWEQIVRSGIDDCDRFLAFADLPNANVGFEIGYALGRKKEVGVARVRASSHRWLKKPPFRGEFVPRLENIKSICQFVGLDSWPAPSPPECGGGDSVLFLCPRKSGASLRIFAPEHWVTPDHNRWNLRTIGEVFDDIGLVVWVISPHNEGEEERDGSENAVLSILAGFAEGRDDLELMVVKSGDAREVADVASHSWCFDSIDDFRRLLVLIDAGWNAPDRPDRQFRGWLPQLLRTPAFSGFQPGIGHGGGDYSDGGSGQLDTVESSKPIRRSRSPSFVRILFFGLVGVILFAFLFAVKGWMSKSSKIVFGKDIPIGTVVRLRADNFDATAPMQARVGEMGNLRIEVPDYEIREEDRVTDRAPRVFLEVLEPDHLVFERFAWDEDENYRSDESWAIPYDRNRITVDLITRGQWDQRHFEKAKKDILKRLPLAKRSDIEEIFDEILGDSGLSLEALKNSVVEKRIPGVPLQDAVETVDHGEVVPSSFDEASSLSPEERDALRALVASTGALFRYSGEKRSNTVPVGSGLVVGDHFVFTSPGVLPVDFQPPVFPASLPPGQSMVFSLAEGGDGEEETLPVQDVLVVRPEYTVLMVPMVGRMVRQKLGARFSEAETETILSNRFVFLSPDERDQKCVAIGYPVAGDDTPEPYHKLLSITANSPRKRVSVGRVYSSSVDLTMHTAATMEGSEGGPVAFFDQGGVGILGFDRGGKWLGEGYRLSVASNLVSSSPEKPLRSRQARDLVKSHLVEYANREIDQLPGAMQGEKRIWLSYFSPEKSTYELRKKLAELRTTVWAYEQSANGDEGYRHFRQGWVNFRAAYKRRNEDFARAIPHFEALLERQPQYYLGWLRLGEALDKTGQREKAYAVLQRGYAQFRSHSADPVWGREVEASFLNTLFLIGKLLGEQTDDPAISGKLRSDSRNYFERLRQVCPYHLTLAGPEN